MKFLFLLLGITCCTITFCKAQECESVQKIEAQDGTAYMGMVGIPANKNTTGNTIYAFLLAKSIIKSDTSYLLSIGINAVTTSTNLSTKGVTFQFDDGSKIVRSNQAVDLVTMIGSTAIMSAEMSLNLDDILQMSNKVLMNITLAEHTVRASKELSASVKEVAKCLPITW